MKSIRAQLTRHVVLAAAAPFAIAWLTTYYVVSAELREQFDAALRAKALAASGAIHEHGDVVEVDESSRLFQELDESVERGDPQTGSSNCVGRMADWSGAHDRWWPATCRGRARAT